MTALNKWTNPPQELIDAAEQLLAWQPHCSKGSSGDLRQKRLRAAIDNLGRDGSINEAVSIKADLEHPGNDTGGETADTSPRTQESLAQELLLRVWRDWAMFDRSKSEYWNPSVSLFDDVKGWAKLRESNAPPEEVSCGSVKSADISTNKDSLPTAKDASDSVGLLLPHEEWSHLSATSQGKIAKWFELATERLQLILDESEAPHQPSQREYEWQCMDCKFVTRTEMFADEHQQTTTPVHVSRRITIETPIRGQPEPAKWKGSNS